MKRILIIGSPGAGKSTLARKLAAKTKLPLYHLDMLWHRPDKTHISREEFDSKLSDILQRSAWIIDGDYSRTFAMRMRYADTVIWLNIPKELCLAGIAARVGQARSDMPWTETELDPAFYEYVENYHNTELPIFTERLKGFTGTIYTLHSYDEIELFLERLPCLN